MDLLLKFKDHLTQGKDQPSKATVKNYLADLRKFIRWYETYYQRLFHPLAISPAVIEVYKSQVTDVRSLKRYLSSLRRFFQYLYQLGAIPANPFDQALAQREEEVNPWRLKDFKAFLYTAKASKLTVKNYLIDVRQFVEWLKGVMETEASIQDSTRKPIILEKEVFSRIDDFVIEEYKRRLLTDRQLSPVSINRKLSSLRKYTTWLHDKNIITKDIRISDMVRASEPALSENISEKIETTIEETVDIKATLEDLRELATIEVAAEETIKEYSKFPPLRFFQKSGKLINNTIDNFILLPIIRLIASAKYTLWKLRGRQIFAPVEEVFNTSANDITTGISKKTISKQPKKTNNISTITNPIAISTALIHNLLKASSKPKKPTITNLPKSMYAPLKLSTKNLPLFKKILYHIRYTRPEWYKKYNSFPIVRYFHFALFLIFTTAVGFGLYQSFYERPRSQKPALAAVPTSPPRILSFQGRLTDSTDTPITAATTLRFGIYNSQAASGSALLWEETQDVTPDADGVFSALLGKKTALSQSLFSENPSLYMGITVGSDSELIPRQQLATVAYAANAETLQGLVPITQADAGTANVVLALDSAGNLAIGGTASPKFEATGGTFTLSGKVLQLTTTEDSNGNIILAPDGTGIIDAQRPLQNTRGNVEVNDTLTVTSSINGQSAFIVSQNGIGPIISASSGGTAKFTVDYTGAGTFADSLTINGNSLRTAASTFNMLTSNAININFGTMATGISIASASGTTIINNALTVSGHATFNGGATIPDGDTLTVSGTIASHLFPNANETYDIGSTSRYWRNQYLTNLFMSPSASTSGFWQRNNGALAPTNTADDLLIGGTTATAAKFQIVASSGNASTAGTLTFNTTGTIQTTNNQTLTLGGSTTGNITLSPLNGTGNTLLNGSVGINAAYPLATLDLRAYSGTNAIASVSGKTSFASLIVDNSGSGDLFTASSSGLNRFVIKQNGFVGIGTTNPLAALDVNGSATLSGNLIFNTSASLQTTANQMLTIGGSTTGNILLLPQNSTGMVGVGTTNPLATLDIQGASGILPVANVSGQTAFAAFSVNNNGSGDLITASSSGVTKLRVDTNGNILPGANGTQNIGSSTLNWDTIFSNNVIAGNLTGIQGFWQRNESSLAPYNINDDVLLGSTATSSARIGLINIAAGIPTATLSATSTGLSLSADATVQSLRNGTLTLGGNTTGNITISPLNGSGIVTMNGNVAITGTSLTLANNTNITLGASTTALNFGSNLLNMDTSNTRVGINTNAPTATLDVAGTASISSTFTFRSGLGTIQTTANNPLTIGGSTTGDITLSPLNGSGIVQSTGTLNLASGKTYQINGTDVLSATALGSNVLGSSLTSVGTLIAGTWNATAVGTQYGGTGQNFSSVLQGAVPYFSATGVMSTLATGTPGQCLVTNGASANPAWTDCTSGSNTTNWWTQTNGALSPINSTVDFLMGGTATSSAKFAILNMNNGTPTASISATTAGLSLGGDGSIQSLRNGTLAIGGDTTGNITVSPNAGTGYLNINGDVNIVGAGNSNNLNLRIKQSTGNGGLLFESPSGKQWHASILSNSDLRFTETGVADVMTLKAGGNVGIGTNSPTATLDVNGTASVSGAFALYGTPTIQSTAKQTLTIGGDTTGHIAFAPGNTTTMTLTSAGNVGIGITTPSELLDVSGAALPAMRLSLPGSSAYNMRINTTASNQFEIYDVSATTIPFRIADNASSNTLYIATGGNVGIGTTSPTATLDVTGTASVSSSLKFRTGAGAIQTTANNTLTIGGSTTGNISLNPLNGSGLVEVNGTLRGPMQDKGGQVFNVKAYGAVGNGSTDDTAAVQAAIDAAQAANGGIVYFPAGTYQFASSLDLDSNRGITLQGSNNLSGGAALASILRYTGTGSSFISAQNTAGVKIKNVMILYTSTSFTGYVVDFRNVSGFDSAYGGVEDSWMGGSGSDTAAALVALDKSHTMSLTGNYFGAGDIGILGKAAGTYSNAILIQKNMFNGSTTAAIKNAGEAWRIIDNTFEALAGGGAGAYTHESGVTGNDVTFAGNWFGDVTSGSGTSQITWAGNSLIVEGNYIGFNTGATGITIDGNSSSGIAIRDNDFVSGGTSTGISFGSTINHTNVSITDNTYTTVTTKISGLPAGAYVKDGVNIAIGTSSPLANFDLRATSGTVAAASISAQSSLAALFVDNKIGDLFTASSSGLSRFVIKQNGTIGIGTTTPEALIHIQGDTSTLFKLTSTSTSVAPKLQFANASGHEWHMGAFGSLDKFSVARTGTKDYFVIDNSTDTAGFNTSVGIGTTSPTSQLSVTRPLSSAVTGKALAVFNQLENQDIFAASSSGTTRFRIANNGDVTITGSGGSCTMTGAATTTTCGSDIRLKTNVQNLDNSLEKILALRPVTYNWNDPLLDQSTQIGFIAQEVQQIYPNFVAEMPNGYLGVRYESFIMPAIKAIQELSMNVDSSGNIYAQRLDALEQSIATVSAPVQDTSIQTLLLSLTTKVASLESQLASNNATFSGTLRTDRLIAGSIDGLDDKLATLAAAINQQGSPIYNNSTASGSASSSFPTTPMNNDFINIATLSGELSYIPNFKADFATFTEGIIALGPASLTDAAVSNQLSIGTSMTIADNAINTFGEDLHIQPFRQGKISFMADAVVIETDGNLTVDGNAVFAKDVKVKGKLATNIIVPVPDEDLIIQLSDSDNDKHNKFAIRNGKGEDVVSVNHLGDLVASGSGKFSDIATNTLNIVRGVQADTSINESVASASAGTAVIKSNQTERTIYSPHVKADSLIYITATSNTQGQVPYVARQTADDGKTKTKGSFTVQIPTSVSKDIKFNWWIVN